MGTVWRAYDELLGRTIAIKEVNLPQLAEVDQAELRKRAMREARAAARLSHPKTITGWTLRPRGGCWNRRCEIPASTAPGFCRHSPVSRSAALDKANALRSSPGRPPLLARPGG